MSVIESCRNDNFNVLKSKCKEIENICIADSTDTDNSKMLYDLTVLLCSDTCVTLENIQNMEAATNYISTQKNLLIRLIQIIAETDDFQICLYTIEILHKLLSNNDGDKNTIKEIFNNPYNFDQIVESMYLIHSKFSTNDQYREVFFEVHNKILQIIIWTQEITKRNLSVTTNTVRFIGKLVNLQPKNKTLANNLIWMLKLINSTKRNSEILASIQFYDSLCYFCKLTQKLFAITVILKLMTRNAAACNCMCQNEKIFNLVLDLAVYNGKKYINKKTLMTILYRITKTVNGFKYLSNGENFNKLLQYFTNNGKQELSQNRIAAIKAYTILNRSFKKICIPSSQLNLNLFLPENIKAEGNELVSEESDLEVDSEDSEDEEDDVGNHDNDLKNKIQMKLDDYTDNITETNYFKELFSAQFESGHTIKIFKNLNSRTTIEDRVFRSSKINHHAYPDALMLEPEPYQHFLNTSTNLFSVEHLIYKLQCLEGTVEHKFESKVVYDLDQLYREDHTYPHIPNSNVFEFQDSAASPLSNGEPNSLQFDSRFECGNLRQAIQIEKFEYDLLLNSDTESNIGHQWFYFQVSNMVAGILYTFNINNFIKINSQHNYGMQPVLFSIAEYEATKTGWRCGGEKIIYHGNHYTDENETTQYRTLSFSIRFSFTNDHVYLAYHYPYTYTRLMKILLPLTLQTTPQIYLRVDHLCYTVNGKNEVPLLTITKAFNNTTVLDNRPLVFITARVHPGETNSSWIMEGIIKFLLSNTDEHAIEAREQYIFKIIPMLNPEGVIYGNTRCGLTGSDLNRRWSKPNPTTYPEIYHTKRLLLYAKRNLHQPISTYIDIHGHSRKKFFFLYGCNPKLSWNKRDIQNGDYNESFKVLPRVLQTFNPHFRFNSCKYKIQKDKEGTGRVVMWRDFGIEQSYTLECSYCSGDDGQAMNTQMLSDIGVSVIRALSVVAKNV